MKTLENLIEKYERQMKSISSEEMKKGIQMDIDSLKRTISILKSEKEYVFEQLAHSEVTIEMEEGK